MPELSLNNVIQISVAQSNPGVNAYNTSNLAIITGEQLNDAVQTLSFSTAPDGGSFTLVFGGVPTSSFLFSDSAGTIQTAINLIPGLADVVVTGSIAGQLLILTQPGNSGTIPLAVVSPNSLVTGIVPVVVTPKNVHSGWQGGTLDYAFYTSPQQVGVDFGTSSVTYLQANAVFSQQPNILAGNGQLVVLLRSVVRQTFTFSGLAASGAFEFEYNAIPTASIAWNATTAQIQTALRAVAGLEGATVSGSISSQLLTVTFFGAAATAISVPVNTLMTSAPAAITITPSALSGSAQSISDVISTTQGFVQYFGVMANEPLAVIGQTELLACAAVIQPLNMMGFFVSYAEADIQVGGILSLLASGSFTQTRGLYYGDSSSFGINAVLMMAAYAGRGLSVNFNGSNTTITMHLKQLIGIQPDPSMTQTILNEALVAGADTYPSLQGVPSVFCSGANKFFDQVYNLLWFVGALQVAGFNYLAQSSTKVPQTESGMDGLKGAYRNVCELAVGNQYCAPGQWNSPDTFGNLLLFLDNVSQYGYYIFSTPISQQLQADRVARKSPLCMIALKEAGAIQSGNILIFVNP